MTEREILDKSFHEFGEGTKGYASLNEAIADIKQLIRDSIHDAYDEGRNYGDNW